MRTRHHSMIALAAVVFASSMLFGFASRSEADEGIKKYWEDSYGNDGCSGSCSGGTCCTITIVNPH